jgi:hypothetical protein
MALFNRKPKEEQMPAVKGPSIEVPDPHTQPQPIVPNENVGGYVPVPYSYAHTEVTSGVLGAGTAVQPQNLAYQKELRRPTYWPGMQRLQSWDLNDDYQRQRATQVPQSHSQDTASSGYNTDFAAAPAHPGTSHNPDPQREQKSLSTWSELARYDQNWARQLTGRHFSMASNVRAYPIGGQQPIHRLRNTFRLEPPPNDAHWTDLPPETIQSVPNQDITSRRTPFRRLF